MKEEDDKELDYEVETDEESLKIRRLERELASVSKSEDKKLFLWLGFPFIFIVIYKLYPNLFNPILVAIAILLPILLGIGSTIFRNIRRKRDILIKHGLQCKACGFIPSPFYASGVIGTKKCIKCHTHLDI